MQSKTVHFLRQNELIMRHNDESLQSRNVIFTQNEINLRLYRHLCRTLIGAAPDSIIRCLDLQRIKVADKLNHAMTVIFSRVHFLDLLLLLRN